MNYKIKNITGLVYYQKLVISALVDSFWFIELNRTSFKELCPESSSTLIFFSIYGAIAWTESYVISLNSEFFDHFD